MRTVTTIETLYKFNELSPKSQDRAIDRLWDLNVDHDWWEYTYEDAARIGCEISGFDLDRSNSIDLQFTRTAETVSGAILKEHGSKCDTYKLAQEFEAAISAEHVNDDDLDTAHTEFKRALSEAYLTMLRREYECRTSREAIIESIEANEYEFTEDGRIA